MEMGAGRGTQDPTGYEDLTRRDLATDVYTGFRNSGYSDAQARALTAEINRENSLRQQYVFGSHLDPANEAKNIGMLSWQGDRGPAVMDFLRERGVIDEGGRITPGMDAIQAQTGFIRYEMENDPSYAKTRAQFLSNPDVDPETAARVLGDNYIRWRRTDPKYSQSGYDRINEGYALLRGDSPNSGGPSFESAGGSFPVVNMSAAAGEKQASNKSSLDDLSDALAYLDLSGMSGMSGGAKKAVDLGTRITPGRAGSGGRALKRMGIASLV